MLQISGSPGYTCSRLRLLLQSGFEGVELPVRVENHKYSNGLSELAHEPSFMKTGRIGITIPSYELTHYTETAVVCTKCLRPRVHKVNLST